MVLNSLASSSTQSSSLSFAVAHCIGAAYGERRAMSAQGNIYMDRVRRVRPSHANYMLNLGIVNVRAQCEAPRHRVMLPVSKRTNRSD